MATCAKEAPETGARYGDYTVVAAIVGLKPDTVRKIITGNRQNKTVVKIFNDYVLRRQQLMQQLRTVVATLELG